MWTMLGKKPILVGNKLVEVLEWHTRIQHTGNGEQETRWNSCISDWKMCTGSESWAISRMDTFKILDICATSMTFFGLYLHLKFSKSFILHRASIQCIKGLDYVGLVLLSLM